MAIKQDRPLGELFSDLSRGASELIRQEIQLAKAEMTQKASQAGKELSVLTIGGFVAYAGFLTLIAAAILGLSEFMASWLAALLVGLIIAAIGYLLVQRGIENLKDINPAPRRTIKTLREDKEWINQQIR